MIKTHIKKITRYNDIKQFVEKNERLLIPGMLVFGVVVDFFTFRAIQITTALTVLAIYLVIAGATIAFLNHYDSSRVEQKGKLLKYTRLLAPLLVQFTFGALLSASLIFYWFSGTFSVSWPFILIIGLLMASNDVFRHHYLKPTVQISVYFFILFSLLSIIFPFVFNSISAWFFVLAGIVSLIIIRFYIKKLSDNLLPVQERKKQITQAILGIFVFMNFLYFANIIPPIPLSLYEAGIYHNIERTNGIYTLTTEKESLFQKIIPGQTMRIQENNKLYVFTSIFAPSDLDVLIFHNWEYFDPSKRKWVSKDKLSYKMSGGREGGYRGFSVKSKLESGKWRVSVETKRGQVLGRVKFKVEYSKEKSELITIKK